ncbi:hypothetical protein [Streptomyces sp. NL15-2K]|uniref:hypothetical protein n=1 Tax=Streptomyces sp. NL15-2K TaxID=376149 RepID=UPI000F55F65E|nr:MULTISPECIES: hypothetical protein [Actinomycetes]WKX07764.1 hypothetical protein Q4V64_09850 [Kutzneria buriramensis]GCB50960.1 hypothetical protein SNL152K_8307 [Streptomyces sp. NL15-2K]
MALAEVGPGLRRGGTEADEVGPVLGRGGGTLDSEVGPLLGRGGAPPGVVGPVLERGGAEGDASGRGGTAPGEAVPALSWRGSRPAAGGVSGKRAEALGGGGEAVFRGDGVRRLGKLGRKGCQTGAESASSDALSRRGVAAPGRSPVVGDAAGPWAPGLSSAVAGRLSDASDATAGPSGGAPPTVGGVDHRPAAALDVEDPSAPNS